MNTKAKIILMVMLLMLISASTAMAAETPTIDLPAGAKVEAADDYSAGIFSQLLGPAWTGIAGPNNVFGGLGQYSGLIIAILQVMNLAGLTAASIIIFYQWAVFAVATAHSGQKIGGGVYNSLWVPVRSAFGFALCVPVIHGLSMLQIFIIGAVGLGINGGNMIWTTAATYVTEHVASSPATDTQSQIIDSEALEAIQPLFQGVLLQETFKRVAEHYKEEPEWSYIKEFKEPSHASRWRTVEIASDYVIEHRPLEGEAILWIRPCSEADLGTFGGISIPAPTARMKNGRIDMGDDPVTYQRAHAVTQLRLTEMIKMADALRPWARWHIASDQEIADGRVKRPSGDGFTIAEAYRQRVSQGMATQIAESGNGKKLGDKMREAIGQSAPGQTPAGGWPGAGVLPTILSFASREADIVNYNGGVRPIIVDAANGTYSDTDSPMSKLISWWKDELRVDSFHRTKLETGPKFATQVLLAGRSWSGSDAEGNSAGVVNQAITWMFTDSNLNNNGILASTMRDFNEKNPISATMDFGERCLKVTGFAMGVSAVAGIASMFPGIGGQLAGLVNNGLSLAAMGGLGLVGILCVFIAPLTPLMIWLRGILGWMIHVMLALVGAPLLCIATIFPEGQGFAGQHARKGYVQLLDIAIRPAIMVTCLCMAYALLQVWAMIVGVLFSKFANAATSYSTTDVFWQIGMSIMYVIMIYGAIHLLFKTLVLEGPRTVMTWIGGIGMSLGSVESTADKDTAIVGGVVGKASAGAAGVGAGLSGALGNAKKDKGDDKGDKKQKSDMPAQIAKQE